MDDNEVTIAASETLAELMGGEKHKREGAETKVVEIQAGWRNGA